MIYCFHLPFISIDDAAINALWPKVYAKQNYITSSRIQVWRIKSSTPGHKCFFESPCIYPPGKTMEIDRSPTLIHNILMGDNILTKKQIVAVTMIYIWVVSTHAYTVQCLSNGLVSADRVTALTPRSQHFRCREYWPQPQSTVGSFYAHVHMQKIARVCDLDFIFLNRDGDDFAWVANEFVDVHDSPPPVEEDCKV